MRITSDQFLPATPQRAAQMLCDPAFIEFRSANTEARVEDSVVTGSPAGEFTLTTRRSVTADVIPAQMRAFVGERLKMVQNLLLDSHIQGRLSPLPMARAREPSSSKSRGHLCD